MGEYDNKPKQKPAPVLAKPTSPAPKPKVRVDPAAPVQTALLGGTARLQYSTEGEREGKWIVKVRGGTRDRDEHKPGGTTTRVNELITTAGHRQITGTVEIDGTRESVPSVTLETPRSPTNIFGMWGESKERGRAPTATRIQKSEDLVIHVEQPEIDDAVDRVEIGFSGDLELKHWHKLGNKKFEVVLTPRASVAPTKEVAHDATGSLTVTPRGVALSAIEPLRIPIKIEPGATSQDDHGSRPGTTENAVSAAVRRWGEIYERRMAAVGDLMGQIAISDPVPPDPLWSRLLKAAAAIALNAATAGLGAGLASHFLKVPEGAKAFATAVAEGKKELVKVLVEQTSAAIIQKGVDEAMSKAEAEDPSARRTAHGTLLSPEVYFKWTQREALREAKLDHLTRVESTLTSMTRRLDREHPSMGYRAAIDAHDMIDSQFDAAGDVQYTKSLLAWCTFSAQARLGVGDAARGRDPGTELGTQVDVGKIVPKGEVPARDLDKTPGVLRLELAQLAPGHMIVVRSFIAGFTNDKVVDNLSRKVRDLSIPIVARFNERDALGDKTRRGFVISRNENGVVLADSKGSLMQDMFGGRADHEAAREVFDQIAHQPITPERD